MGKNKEINQSEFVSRLISEIGTSAAKLSFTGSEKPIIRACKLSLVREALGVR